MITLEKCKICSSPFIPMHSKNYYCSNACLKVAQSRCQRVLRDKASLRRDNVKTLLKSVWFKKIASQIRRAGTVEILPPASTMKELRTIMAGLILQDGLYRFVNGFKTDAKNRLYEANHICAVDFSSEYVPVSCLPSISSIEWGVPYKGVFSIDNIVIQSRSHNAKNMNNPIDTILLHYRLLLGCPYKFDGIKASTLNPDFLVGDSESLASIFTKLNHYYSFRLAGCFINTSLLYSSNEEAKTILTSLGLLDSFSSNLDKQYEIIDNLTKKVVRILSNLKR